MTCEPLTNQNLEKLIKLYAKVTYDKRKKKYTVKYCELCFQKKWVKSTVTIPLYKEKLFTHQLDIEFPHYRF